MTVWTSIAFWFLLSNGKWRKTKQMMTQLALLFILIWSLASSLRKKREPKQCASGTVLKYGAPLFIIKKDTKTVSLWQCPPTPTKMEKGTVLQKSIILVPVYQNSASKGTVLQIIKGKMCSTLYTFCLVVIMVADCQEGPPKKALFTNNEKFSNVFSTYSKYKGLIFGQPKIALEWTA